MKLVHALSLGAACALVLLASATQADPPKLQVPTSAFFGTVTGKVKWPPARSGSPKKRPKACEKVTVQVSKLKDGADPNGADSWELVKSVQATGKRAYPAVCEYKLEGVRIRQDLKLEAVFPKDDWRGCVVEAVKSKPGARTKWTNPVNLPNAGGMTGADIELEIQCASKPKPAAKPKKAK